jgi:hypothetical protein
MTTTDILIILATLLSPVIAVQVTRILDERKEKRGRKLHVYKTLMGTRGSITSPAHVEALNLIELEFSNKEKNEKLVLKAWKQYLDHLSRTDQPLNWGEQRISYLGELLEVMGRSLGYEFTKVEIKNSLYMPRFKNDLENEQQELRNFLLQISRGQKNFPIQFINPTSNFGFGRASAPSPQFNASTQTYTSPPPYQPGDSVTSPPVLQEAYPPQTSSEYKPYF